MWGVSYVFSHLMAKLWWSFASNNQGNVLVVPLGVPGGCDHSVSVEALQWRAAAAQSDELSARRPAPARHLPSPGQEQLLQEVPPGGMCQGSTCSPETIFGVKLERATEPTWHSFTCAWCTIKGVSCRGILHPIGQKTIDNLKMFYNNNNTTIGLESLFSQ